MNKYEKVAYKLSGIVIFLEILFFKLLRAYARTKDYGTLGRDSISRYVENSAS